MELSGEFNTILQRYVFRVLVTTPSRFAWMQDSEKPINVVKALDLCDKASVTQVVASTSGRYFFLVCTVILPPTRTVICLRYYVVTWYLCRFKVAVVRA